MDLKDQPANKKADDPDLGIEAISAQRQKLSHLRAFLDEHRSEVPDHNYLHLLLTESSGHREKAIEELRRYAQVAHEGARLRIRAPLAESLRPVDLGTTNDPAFGYPEDLDLRALKGLFGELLAGIAAEHYELFGSNGWEVPAYLFRTHTAAFQKLERIRQGASDGGAVVGRTGDDCIAFERDCDGRITRWMACEAKCTKGHDAGAIADCHEQLNTSALQPIDLLRLIEALEDYKKDEYAASWQTSLRNLYWSKAAERCDAIVYVCGRRPKKRLTWIDPSAPHKTYTVHRKLAAIEIHLNDVEATVKYVYSRDR